MTTSRIAHYLALLLVAFVAGMHGARAQTSAGETQGVQTIGEPGITRSVASLMQAQAERDAREGEIRDLREGAETTAMPSEAKSGGVGVASVASGLQFDAITLLTDTNFLRPDESIDVGPTQILVVANGRMRSFDKQTGVADGIINVDPSVFFASVLPTNAAASFHHVRFDRTSQRWFIMTTEGLRQSAGSYLPNRIAIAVSNGATISNATQFTFFWFLPAASAITDAASLGLDTNALYIGANRLDLSTTQTALIAPDVHVVRKASLLGAGPIVVTSFPDFTGTGAAGINSPVGVDNVDPTSTQGYLVASRLSAPVTLWRVNDPGGSPSLSPGLAITGVAAISVPPDVPSSGTAARLQINGYAFRTASVRNGHLWVSQHIGVDASGSATGTRDRTAIRWYEIADLATTPTLRQSGTIFDAVTATAPRHYFMPSLAASGQGHTFFGFNTAGTNEYINAAASVRLRDDPLGTVQPATLLSASQNTYRFSLSVNLWGSRSRTVIDPDDDMSGWTVQQYVSAANEWSLRVAKLLAPPPPDFLPTPTTVVAGSTTNITLNAISTANGEGFFDPGPGFAKRLRVEMLGFTVNSVQYVSPTQIVVNATANAGVTTVSGVRVTNPDGRARTYGALTPTLTIVAENALGSITEPSLFPTPCSGTCSVQIQPGTSVSLLATPTAGTAFLNGWSGSVPGVICTGNSCNFVINENTTMYATFALNNNFYSDLNVDGSSTNPACRITSDGAMIVRFLRGLTGAAILGTGLPGDAVIGPSFIPKGVAYRKPRYDVDGNGVVDAEHDGVLILRYLAGFRGDALIANALGPQARRTTSAAIESYLAGQTPSLFPCSPL
jgi:Divergent InlB B-repeat domain